nr:MAG TPA: hypothetical protein [Caudoviricetes sp.]
MEYTAKYKLNKPTYDDDVDIQVLNKNFDIIDSKLQSVSVSDNTLHIDDNNYPLNFLPLTGGTVTGNTEIKGTLTNNGKDVGKLFNGSAEIKSILDWDKMKDVYGSTMTSTTTIYKGKSKTITYPNWCEYSENMGIRYFNPINKDLYLIDDFTNYDEVVINVLISANNNMLYTWKSKVLEYMFENQGFVNISELSGTYMSYHGFNQYGTKTATDVSTRKHFKYYTSKGWFVDVYGVKYARN